MEGLHLEVETSKTLVGPREFESPPQLGFEKCPFLSGLIASCVEKYLGLVATMIEHRDFCGRWWRLA
jgi:hypothetical protein